MALLHPLMPFVTERLWQALPHEGPALIAAAWPATQAHSDARALRQFEVGLQSCRGHVPHPQVFARLGSQGVVVQPKPAMHAMPAEPRIRCREREGGALDVSLLLFHSLTEMAGPGQAFMMIPA